MSKAKPAAVEQLRTLNELLGRVSDPERAEHARRALEFAYQEHPEDLEHLQLGDYVDKLADLHFGDSANVADFAFAHWHVPRLEDFSPLWIRQAIVGEMKKLAGRREGLLLVTGLREAVCPAGKYWTKYREAQYQRVRDWIDELACAWATRGSRLQVVVL
ncbi:hypothetical protein QEH59_02250 [Coraliomargarita sp. SDUM461004]|uniref:Uncharacterized protein n=1 Tax=Thalassobacterium sedimentorum TaxID=3041258 RepID=A0ABU1AEY2_9BACT|nr:hypothetical protein [Coraliomargarita sp. SDUM461004]MDQ8193229.1 hypothetical protein [Coraliomargarita sp. SDUM461004]